ncbi:glycosyltransferase family 2 protein [Dongia sedimenti]|uniref:Glycosyltransferase family 2 protein n=1 Tax=Dongia sedimenti TaxID=3064282 RepID=A0ABU0YT94_9PROT|nr:glycosyltransferase family 2 protein [Rhodospirillaceae bacterium R-7]
MAGNLSNMGVRPADAAGVHQPGVAVVIPTLNEERTIRDLIGVLRSDRLDPARTRFVVTDGGSTDRTRSIVSELIAENTDVALIDNPKKIQSAGINLAARELGEGWDVLIRCDAHAEYPPHYIPMLLESLARSGADSVVVPMDSIGDTCLQRAVAWVSNTPVGTGGSRHRAGTRSGFVDHGHHAAFRAAMYRRLGGYDETFSHNEDAEYDCRLRKAGGRIYLDADIRIAYHPRGSFGSLWRQYFNYGRGRARTVLRHPDSLRLRQAAVPGHVVLFVASLLATPMTWLGWIWPAVYLAILAATSLGLAAKHRSPCGLLGGPSAAIMHFAWALGFLGTFLRAPIRGRS